MHHVFVMLPFSDRSEAGERLGHELRKRNWENPIVLALPRGGLPVAAAVSQALKAPLDVLIVKKIGAPMNPEFAIGAMGEDFVARLQEKTVGALGIDEEDLEILIAEARQKVEGSVEELRQGGSLPDLRDRDAILVDDGIATGATFAAAAMIARDRGARSVTIASPVCAKDSKEHLTGVADQVICLATPELFRSVGEWYLDFHQLSQEEVLSILAGAGSAGDRRMFSEEVVIQTADEVELPGTAAGPRDPLAWIVFVHGSGSGRFSPRNQWVASRLRFAGYATLLFDLLTPDEAEVRSLVFDIRFLAARVESAIDFLEHSGLPKAPLVLFGASTGAGAALWAASEYPRRVEAVISRGGRPDLAGGLRLSQVNCPVLLIVGGEDREVLELNRETAKRLSQSEVVVIPGATHLFEEAGALEEVVEKVERWLGNRFGARKEAG